MKRILNAIKFGYWIFVNPKLIQKSTFLMLSDMLKLIMKVAEEGRPMTTKIAMVNVDNGEKHDIVTIWCGYGAGSDPIDRIKELLKENEALKRELFYLTQKSTENGTEK